MSSVLSFHKKYEDNHLIELSVNVKSKNISCDVDIYVDKLMINDLIEGLSAFTNKQELFEWVVSDKSDKTSNYFYLRPYFYNMKKHIAIEIDVIEKAFEIENYKANFHLITEMDYIDKLISELKDIVHE